MTEALDAALSYLARGWCVLPGHWMTPLGCSCRQPDCSRPGKHPRVKWLEFQDRKPTEDEVRFWWRKWPNANPIIITGRISGIVAIDVDPRHGGDEAWREWTRRNPVPATVTSLTGGGGQHYLYNWPGQDVRPATNILSPGYAPDGKTKLESGVDFRGDGSYILAPPSTHESGRLYAWDSEAHPDDMPIADMPKMLLLLILKQHAGNFGEEPDDGMRRSKLDLEALSEGKLELSEGGRNVTMTRVVGMLARGGMTIKELAEMADNINQASCKPPLDDREMKRIVESVHRREAQKVKVVDSAESAMADPEMDPLIVATSLWNAMGVQQVTDWYQLQGDDLEYVLVTPDDEVRFPDLLDYQLIRTQLLNHLGVLAPTLERKGGFDRTAQILRLTAKPVVVDARLSTDRVAGWINAYAAKNGGTREVTEEELDSALQSGPVMYEGEVLLRPNRLALFVETQYGEKMPVAMLRKLLKRAGWGEVGSHRAWKFTGMQQWEKEAVAVAAVLAEEENEE